MGGVLTSTIFRYFVSRKENGRLTLVLLLFSAILIGLSVITHPYWGLAKLGATPAWLFLCSAITIIAFLIIYWIADVYGKSKWFDLIKPAGTATILCYLVPYFVYSVKEILSDTSASGCCYRRHRTVQIIFVCIALCFHYRSAYQIRSKNETLK